MLSPRRLLQQIPRLWQLALNAVKELCLRLFLVVLLFVGYVVLALIFYAALKQVLVPQKTHYLPVHLYFSPHCYADNVRPVLPSWPGDQSQYEIRYNYQRNQRTPSYQCTYPYAEFHLASGERLLSPGHTYSITVELDMPESPQNEQLGMFMINVTIFSYTRQQLATSIRPATLHYKSSLLQTFNTIFYALPLLLGFWEEKQTLSITMMEEYQEPYSEGSIYAQVTILNHKVRLYNAVLVFDAEFTGLTYYLHFWPISMSTILISGVFFSLSAVTIMIWLKNTMDRLSGRQRQRRYSAQRMYLRAPDLAPIPEEEESDSGSTSDRSRRRVLPVARRNQLQCVEDVSTAPESRTSETDSISSVSEVATESDINELENALQNLHGQAATGQGSGESTPTASGYTTPHEDESRLRHRPSS